MPDPRPSLRHLVIVPAFNEADSIARVVRDIHQHLPGFDVVVIDDGSRDATLRAIPASATVISLPFNLGIGGAMQTGYRYAAMHAYDVAIQVDADGQHPPSEVPRLLEALYSSQADMVIGSRFIEPGHYHQTVTRMMGIRLLGGLIRLLSGRRVTDCTSGFRVVNRRVIRAFAHWYPEDYPEPEVVLLLLKSKSGFQIHETPATMEQRTTGQTSIPFFYGLFYVAKVAVCLLLDTARNPWPAAKVDPPSAVGWVERSETHHSQPLQPQQSSPPQPQPPNFPPTPESNP